MGDCHKLKNQMIECIRKIGIILISPLITDTHNFLGLVTAIICYTWQAES